MSMERAGLVIWDVDGTLIAADADDEGIDESHQQLDEVVTEEESEPEGDQPAYPGAADTLKILDAHGLVQTVLTETPRSAAEITLRAAGLDRHIDFDIGAFGSDARDRSDLPAVVATRFESKYGKPLSPARTVVIGDAPHHIAYARHARFGVIVVAHRTLREELAQHSPDAIVDALYPNVVAALVESLTSTWP
ncbi:HAD family hydrolase [Nocardia sp. NPDC056100]|uniref:HAD family hydrolase n=1 Tax=Nocardia sp. NPDC056100 TaxID=3345712 RepID=UPI0035D69086